MDLLYSSSCIQSTMPVIYLTITVDGGDGTDCNCGKSADADRDNARNEDDQHTNRETGTVSPAYSNPGNDGRMFYMRRM